MLKPVSEGSSFGVVIVKEDRAHPPQEVGRDDWPYGDALLAEAFVDGKELTCAAMGDRVFDIIEIESISEELLRLRRKVRERRLPAHSSGKS